jgi:hypothetical protein
MACGAWFGVTGARTAPGVARLDTLKGNAVPLPPRPRDDAPATRPCPAGVPQLFFDVSAVRACDLTGECGVGRTGIPYNQRAQLNDPNAIVYVRNNRLPGQDEPKGFYDSVAADNPAIADTAQAADEEGTLNRFILGQLREQVQNGKRLIEPMVLRAPAGACMLVRLRNHLPAMAMDPPTLNGQPNTAHFSDNFMSMILDGFNYNQLRTSSSIGLAAPMVARYSLEADGANFGVNGRSRGRPQSNLIPPCAADASHDSDCTSSAFSVWYAGDYRLDKEGRQVPTPVEFGVLPLSSFADVIKQPGHGAVGALVIGPQDSTVCASDDPQERAADSLSDTSATVCFSPRLDSAGKLLAEDQRKPLRYRDLVLVLQDAVDAKVRGQPVENLKGAEEPDDYGVKAANYRSEPIWARRGGDPSVPFEDRNLLDYAGVLSSKAQGNGETFAVVSPADADQQVVDNGAAVAAKHIRCQAGIDLLPQAQRHVCDPETPVFVATDGSEVRLRVVQPGGHTRQQAFAVHGHDWNPQPYFSAQAVQPDNAGVPLTHATFADATARSWIDQGAYNAIGPKMSANLLLQAGGRQRRPADYLWRSQPSFLFDGGIWGLLRVIDRPSTEHTTLADAPETTRP